MLCPVCNRQNLAFSVNCFQCGTTLIHEARGHSTAYLEGARGLDSRAYGIVGSVVAFILAILLLKTLLSEWYLNEPLVCFVSTCCGGVVGRSIAWWKWRELLRQSK